MAATVILGMQWGDEGKGKIIDVLAERADVVVRFQGGNNAGHTVEIGDNRFVLHLIPSGIFRDDTLCVIGNGVVVDPLGLVDEIVGLERKNIRIRHRLQVSSRSHLVFPFHKLIDGWRDSRGNATSLGTTRRGIGPTYSDKASRVGIRASALRDLPRFEESFRRLLSDYNRFFADHGLAQLNADEEWQRQKQAATELAPLVTDTVVAINRAVQENKAVLFEGAQGVWLDIDHGTYPYVTSSNTSIGGVCTGSGLAPKHLGTVIGVAKAYTTRVGEGPFPTELRDADGSTLRDVGREYGATTGRPRRCGWFDVVASRYAVMLNGIDRVAITKLDVLDRWETIKICTAYRQGNEVIAEMPADTSEFQAVEPVYEEWPGWKTDTSGIRQLSELPANAKAYLDRLAQLLGVPIGIVSVGPRRQQVFFV